MLQNVFATAKPIIAMMHFLPLPGAPHYDASVAWQVLSKPQQPIWQPDAAQTLRLQHNLGCNNMVLLFNINAEFAASLGLRDIAARAQGAVFSSLT